MPIDLKAAIAPKAQVAAYPALKASIVLFDCNPGTRSWTVPEGVSKIRAFVVGAGGASSSYITGGGGGYSERDISVTPGQVLSYTVGSGQTTTGGTSSFGGIISATGGSSGNGAPGGIGSGGSVNTSGGDGSGNGGGGGSGHAFGNGQKGSQMYGGGFSLDYRSFVDGWKIGLLPKESEYGFGGALVNIGGSPPVWLNCTTPGMGGGGCSNTSTTSNAAFGNAHGGIGGGGGAYVGKGGPGLVGIEVIA